VFFRNEFKEELKQWNVLKREQLPEIAYVASGGFSKPQLYPSAALPVIRGLEKFLAAWPHLFATRLLIVLGKESA
jgi:hypothetical protein